jgi:hypothetical protein
MPYNETIIEDYPVEWINFYVGYFPNYSEFKPTLPKWWEDMQSQCRNDECDHQYPLKDAEVFDPFVDQSTCRGNEVYVRHNCPKCKEENYTRKILYYILEDQIIAHLYKHRTNTQ